MPKIICGRCGEKFKCVNPEDSDEYCTACLDEMKAEKLNETLQKHAKWVKKHNEKVDAKLSKKWTFFLDAEHTYVKESLITVEQANKAFADWLKWRSRFCYKCEKYPCYDCFFKSELKKLADQKV